MPCDCSGRQRTWILPVRRLRSLLPARAGAARGSGLWRCCPTCWWSRSCCGALSWCCRLGCSPRTSRVRWLGPRSPGERMRHLPPPSPRRCSSPSSCPCGPCRSGRGLCLYHVCCVWRLQWALSCASPCDSPRLLLPRHPVHRDGNPDASPVASSSACSSASSPLVRHRRRHGLLGHARKAGQGVPCRGGARPGGAGTGCRGSLGRLPAERCSSNQRAAHPAPHGPGAVRGGAVLRHGPRHHACGRRGDDG